MNMRRNSNVHPSHVGLKWCFVMVLWATAHLHLGEKPLPNIIALRNLRWGVSWSIMLCFLYRQQPMWFLSISLCACVCVDLVLHFDLCFSWQDWCQILFPPSIIFLLSSTCVDFSVLFLLIMSSSLLSCSSSPLIFLILSLLPLLCSTFCMALLSPFQSNGRVVLCHCIKAAVVLLVKQQVFRLLICCPSLC